MARFYPEIIDLTKSPATSSEPIFVNSDSDNSVTLHAPCPKDRQDKDRSRRRKREVDSTEDGELLEISTPTLKIGETQNAKTVQKHDGNARLSGKYDMKPEEHRQRHERKHRRRDDYSRDPSPRETHRSHSPVPHFPPSGVSPSFFVDVNPAPLPTMDSSRQPPRADESSKLLLPAHVSVFGSADGSVPVEILPPSNLPSNDDYIQYLDYDDSKVVLFSLSHTLPNQISFVRFLGWSDILMRPWMTWNPQDSCAKIVGWKANTRPLNAPWKSYAFFSSGQSLVIFSSISFISA
jgi:hypothetical protein